jgi:hypothetical protein
MPAKLWPATVFSTASPLPVTEQYASEEPVFAGKVTCGVRSETSGQSWLVKYGCHGPVHSAKPEFKVWQRYPAETFGRLAARDKDFVPSVSNASLHWGLSTCSLEFLTFIPNQPTQRPFYSSDGRGDGAFASNCSIAGPQTWTGGPLKLLCRENLALSTALSSVMSPSKVRYNPCRRRRQTHCCRPHQIGDGRNGF